MKAATAHIDIDALRHNFSILKSYAPDSKALAVVKANGYGHGLLEVARTVNDLCDGFAVARIEEALALRSGGIVKRVLLLEGFFSPSDLPILVINNIETVVHTPTQLEALEQAELERPVSVWLKIDTGMHRLGIRPEEVADFVARLEACDNVQKPVRFITHFGCADELDSDVTARQIEAFNTLTAPYEGEHSLAASPGILLWPDSHQDWIRPGVSMYGVSPLAEKTGADFNLKPVMTLTSSLIAVRTVKQGEAVGYGANWVSERDTKIGVIAIGYGDGYPRMAPNGTPVYINGRIVPLSGRVSMDMLTVDLGPDAADQVGDEAVLWGEPLPSEIVAQHIGTIAYELVTKLTARVNMHYR